MITAIAMLVACSSSTDGSPAAPSPASSVEPSTATLDFPERPASLSTADVDPCSLVPEEAKLALDIDQPPYADATRPDARFTGPFCSWSVSEWGNYGVILSNDFTATQYFEQARGMVESVEVGGFGAVLNPDNAIQPVCYLVVDSSDDGMVWLAVNDRRSLTAEQQAGVCDRAQEFASVVLTTLQAQQ